MTTSAARKRVVASEKFEDKGVKKNFGQNKDKKNSIWSSSLPVSPVTLGFILFVVVGSSFLPIIRAAFGRKLGIDSVPEL
ncbi:hypothetical protein GpartN1_g3279.t1 [Galdieria partita]|uniref:Uncharacterized protein n=1 Tax=Galdieria partita TaxID=83374 RepID=A0A9C7PQV5_9RHOD|nr:hypothetical protein GpartN1_g133.t1 [Galdieria partita]GJQ11488.1 hypothetical protein GpartN1_g3279.t1 [Galdieria partita]